jgi:hypothetical protein
VEQVRCRSSPRCRGPVGANAPSSIGRRARAQSVNGTNEPNIRFAAVQRHQKSPPCIVVEKPDAQAIMPAVEPAADAAGLQVFYYVPYQRSEEPPSQMPLMSCRCAPAPPIRVSTQDRVTWRLRTLASQQSEKRQMARPSRTRQPGGGCRLTPVPGQPVQKLPHRTPEASGFDGMFNFTLL